MRDRINILYKNNVINEKVMLYVNNVIDYLLAKDFNNEEMETFITHLAMASQRAINNEEVMIFPNEIWEQVTENKCYGESLKIYEDLLKNCPTEYPLDEEHYIIMHLCNMINKKEG